MTKNPTVVFRDRNVVCMEERPLPVPAKNELLIRTLRTLISTGTELTMLAGDVPPQSSWAHHIQYPCLPGYDNVGIVTAVGADIDKTWIGRRVASYGGHAAWVSVPIDVVHAIPAGVDDEQATFFTIAEIVMNGLRRSQLTWGESVAIYGLGLLGQLAARLAVFCGARPVIGIDTAPARLDLLRTLPAVLCVNPAGGDVEAEVLRATRDRKVDVVIELTGNQNLIPREFAILKSQGRFVVLSSPRGPTAFDFHDLCNGPSFTIIGAHNFSHPLHETPDNPWTKKRHVEFFFDRLTSRDLDLSGLVTHRAPWSEAPALYSMLLKDRSHAMGVILQWDQACA